MTGFNDAFLLRSRDHEKIVTADASSASIIFPYFRGQDLGRWHTEGSEQRMIVMKSSSGHKWPWSDEEGNSEAAEQLFEKTYPGIYAHMKPFETALRGRKNQVKHWWELSSCAFWDEFTKPKIMYQEIQFHPSYSLDVAGHFGNNKTFFLSSNDLFLLAMLNSPLMWWYNWRYLPHMKDEALSPVAFKMAELPIAEPTPAIRTAAETAVRRLIEITASQQQTQRTVLDWLRVEYTIEKPGNKLQSLTKLDSDAFVAEVKRIRGKKLPLTAPGLAALRSEYARSIEPARTLAIEAAQLERTLSDLVNEAYGLTPAEVQLMWDTAPPRMPI